MSLHDEIRNAQIRAGEGAVIRNLERIGLVPKSPQTESRDAVAGQVDCRVRPLVERLRAAALPGTKRRALDEEAAAEIELLREMLEDLAKAVWMLDQGGFIVTHDDECEAECDILRRIARRTVDAYTAYRRPNA